MKKSAHILILMSFALLAGSVLAQKKAQKKLLKEANLFYEYENYIKARPLYQKAYGQDASVKHSYRLGVSVFYTEYDRSNALEYFIPAIEKGFQHVDYFAGFCYHAALEFDLAAKHFDRYKQDDHFDAMATAEELDHYIAIAKRAKEMMANPTTLTIENLGSGINGKYDDYAPLVSGDRSLLLFTSRRPVFGNVDKDPSGRFYEDIYISRQNAGVWSIPVGVDTVLNTPLNDAGVALSADGQKMILFRTGEDEVSGNLFWSDLVGESWTEAVPCEGEINSKYQEFGASITPDGNTLYFSSTRPGGFGGRDLYRSVKLPDGEWSKAQNLGDAINSTFDDDAPFIHPDGKTLFFSSNGHTTIGGFDIFKTVLDEEGRPGAIENLGYPINTVQNDLFFTATPDGKLGYFSSLRPEGYGGQDIYVVSMPADEPAITLIKGEVHHQGNPLKATIKVISENGEERVGRYLSNKSTGKFLLVIPKTIGHTVEISAKGYQQITRAVKFSILDGYSEEEWNLEMQPE